MSWQAPDPGSFGEEPWSSVPPAGPPGASPPGATPPGTAYPTGAAPASPPPGWYPDAAGMLRWWDGYAWGPTAPGAAGPAGPNTTMGMLSHLLGLFTGFLGPLIVYLVTDRADAFTRDQAAEALNFQLTLMIGFVGLFVGFFLFIFVAPLVVVLLWLALMGMSLADWVLSIIGAVRANRGERYRYPVCIRFVRP